jgi:hypothetical protein
MHLLHILQWRVPFRVTAAHTLQIHSPFAKSFLKKSKFCINFIKKIWVDLRKNFVLNFIRNWKKKLRNCSKKLSFNKLGSWVYDHAEEAGEQIKDVGRVTDDDKSELKLFFKKYLMFLGKFFEKKKM